MNAVLNVEIEFRWWVLPLLRLAMIPVRVGVADHGGKYITAVINFAYRRGMYLSPPRRCQRCGEKVSAGDRR